jgi:hypothetical protein
MSLSVEQYEALCTSYSIVQKQLMDALRDALAAAIEDREEFIDWDAIARARALLAHCEEQG